ncbi:hypothetical protein [Amycolatopsis sp.]|uniref:hypothetical protein n=1 Tax=Amycolatopsis sp. TaxID=37632 RepID=UPI002E0BAF26|nr:hypothetical protein [Amycolatopsis sp.]
MAAMVATTGVAQASPAGVAGGNYGECGVLPVSDNCYIEAPGFPGGTVMVDVDVIPSPGGEDFENHFDLTAPGQIGLCRAQFKAGAPNWTWWCERVNAGTLQLNVRKRDNEAVKMAIRW